MLQKINVTSKVNLVTSPQKNWITVCNNNKIREEREENKQRILLVDKAK